jgi:hypothetical protein
MDFDFVARIRKEKFLFIPEILATSIPGGISSAQYDLSLKESTIVVKKYDEESEVERDGRNCFDDCRNDRLPATNSQIKTAVTDKDPNQ